eukprot:585034-Prymnesium_polylepis.1
MPCVPCGVYWAPHREQPKRTRPTPACVWLRCLGAAPRTAKAHPADSRMRVAVCWGGGAALLRRADRHGAWCGGRAQACGSASSAWRTASRWSSCRAVRARTPPQRSVHAARPPLCPCASPAGCCAGVAREPVALRRVKLPG